MVALILLMDRDRLDSSGNTCRDRKKKTNYVSPLRGIMLTNNLDIASKENI